MSDGREEREEREKRLEFERKQDLEDLIERGSQTDPDDQWEPERVDS